MHSFHILHYIINSVCDTWWKIASQRVIIIIIGIVEIKNAFYGGLNFAKNKIMEGKYRSV